MNRLKFPRFKRISPNRIAIRLALVMGGLIVFTTLTIGALVEYVWERDLNSLKPELRQTVERILDDDTSFVGGYTDFDTAPEIFIPLLLPLLLGLVAALWLAGRTAKPLEAISRTADQVAHGDFSARIALKPKQIKSTNETDLLAQNFNLMAESLERLEAERKFTAAAIAHELRTPLTILRGKLESLKYGVTSFSESEVDAMIAQIEVLTRLVNDLKTLSLAEAGKLTLEREKFDLAELVRTVCTSFEAGAVVQGVELVVQAQNPIWVMGDRGRLQQVLGNLLENALQHTPSNGSIAVALCQTPQSLQLSVTDSGPGISEQDLPHIFDRFYRTEKSRGRGGSGLGLAIVQALVELHSGTIEARNRPQGGAEFVVNLEVR